MSANSQENKTTIDLEEMHQYATILKMKGKSTEEIKAALLEHGIDEASADTVMEWVKQDTINAIKMRAKRDMLIGALFCLGGWALSFTHFRSAFWVMILFGGIKLFKGFMDHSI